MFTRDVSLAVEQLESRELLAVFPVTSTADTGDGSLRAAILAANEAVGPDRIEFSIGSGAQTIAVATQLPFITESVVIDATTQSGYGGSPLIELNGSGITGEASGLSIATADATVRGLSIVGFGAAGIVSTEAATMIVDNWIGINNGGGVVANGTGILLRGTDAVVTNNVVSGNTFTAIAMAGDNQPENRHRIEDNIIGYTPSLSAPAPNEDGISSNGSGRDTIRGNIIAGNTQYGINIEFVGAGMNTISDNFIGTKSDGADLQGNLNGIRIFGTSNTVENNVIANSQEEGILMGEFGDSNRFVRNEIRNNRIGIAVQAGNKNVISENSIHSNQQLGIDLLGDASNPSSNLEGVTENDGDDVLNSSLAHFHVNFPIISQATQYGGNIAIHGELKSFPNSNFRLEFFGNQVADPSGNGEGKFFLGAVDVETDSDGNASFVVAVQNVADTEFVTATSTILDSDPTKSATSEFSAAMAVSPQPPAADSIGAFNAASATFFLRNTNDSGIADVPAFNYGIPNWIPLVGDWNGDGTDTIGLYNPATATFFLRNSNNSGIADVSAFNYGIANWVPLAGDWNGDGIDTIGVYSPESATFFLRNSNDSGIADVTPFNYGLANWTPLAGDWNGNGTDTIGAYNAATASYFLRNTNNSGIADVPAFNFGIAGWTPLVGDWNSDGTDTIGAFNSATATFFLRNSNDSGVADIPAFNYGLPGWIPLTGDWDASDVNDFATLDLSFAALDHAIAPTLSGFGEQDLANTVEDLCQATYKNSLDDTITDSAALPTSPAAEVWLTEPDNIDIESELDGLVDSLAGDLLEKSTRPL